VKCLSLIDVVLSRRSIRNYDKKEIPKEVLDQILEAGRLAPSAANKQPWHFIVVTDEAIKHELSKGLFGRFIKNAPLTIVGCAHKDRIAGRWSVISTAIALQNMVIAAWSLGVGSCWIGAFDENKVRELLSIPDRYHVVAVIPFGYPAKSPGPKGKKSIDKITSFNKFSK
jgi:nitroreductase